MSELSNEEDNEENEWEEDGPAYQYINEFGRQYLGGTTEHYLPVDEQEGQRQHLSHFIYKTLFSNKLLFSPIQNPARILDIGCGSGTWVRDIALTFPDAKVTGNDIHPLVENKAFPHNVEIVCEDANLGDYGDYPYSLIHTRTLLGSFTDFRVIIGHSFRYLQPGAWLECHELWPFLAAEGKEIDPASRIGQWSRTLDEAWMKLGRPIRIANKLKGWLERAGFVDVHEEIFKSPVNSWPADPKFKMIGKYNSKIFRETLVTIAYKPFRDVYGWSREETEIFASSVRQEILTSKDKLYSRMYAVWGRKPEDAKMERLGSFRVALEEQSKSLASP